MESVVSEEGRIRFLLERDGIEATVTCVGRTLRIYRTALLDRNHHAGRDGFRRGFIGSYCSFKRWLMQMHACSAPEKTSR